MTAGRTRQESFQVRWSMNSHPPIHVEWRHLSYLFLVPGFPNPDSHFAWTSKCCLTDMVTTLHIPILPFFLNPFSRQVFHESNSIWDHRLIQFSSHASGRLHPKTVITFQWPIWELSNMHCAHLSKLWYTF